MPSQGPAACAIGSGSTRRGRGHGMRGNGRTPAPARRPPDVAMSSRRGHGRWRTRILNADLLVAMDHANVAELRARAPAGHVEKIVLFRSFDPEVAGSEDPGPRRPRSVLRGRRRLRGGPRPVRRRAGPRAPPGPPRGPRLSASRRAPPELPETPRGAGGRRPASRAAMWRGRTGVA